MFGIVWIPRSSIHSPKSKKVKQRKKYRIVAHFGTHPCQTVPSTENRPRPTLFPLTAVQPSGTLRPMENDTLDAPFHDVGGNAETPAQRTARVIAETEAALQEGLALEARKARIRRGITRLKERARP